MGKAVAPGGAGAVGGVVDAGAAVAAADAGLDPTTRRIRTRATFRGNSRAGTRRFATPRARAETSRERCSGSSIGDISIIWRARRSTERINPLPR